MEIGKESNGLQVFPTGTPGIVPESRESGGILPDSDPVRNGAESLAGAGSGPVRPADRPAHTPGPWFVESRGGLLEIICPGQQWEGNPVIVAEVPTDLGPPDYSDAAADARLLAAAPQLLESLLAVEWAGEDETEELFETEDCCPNCGAAAAGKLHFTHCELRDSLDAALGVTSPRLEVAS